MKLPEYFTINPLHLKSLYSIHLSKAPKRINLKGLGTHLQAERAADVGFR